jgi:D-arginine dehydrogenase
MGFDFIVIGAGMAGASVAAQLAEHASVLLLEREEMPGHHTTGRSAALFTENYGNDAIRRLTSASRSFLDSPPDGFTDLALLTPRGCLYVARNGEGERLHELARESGSGAELVDAKRVRQLVPIIRSEVVEGGLMEAGASDIEVNALHHGYLRRVKALGGRMLTGADVLSIAPASNGWIVTTSQGRHHGSILINAAGAWADHIGALAGAAPIGLRPLRRTAAIVAPPPGVKVERWPAVIDAAETFYF